MIPLLTLAGPDHWDGLDSPQLPLLELIDCSRAIVNFVLPVRGSMPTIEPSSTVKIVPSVCTRTFDRELEPTYAGYRCHRGSARHAGLFCCRAGRQHRPHRKLFRREMEAETQGKRPKLLRHYGRKRMKS